ncbi:unnamed protein product [Trichobilharzia regenti]|nr:unnamed protein product [Trichobilharzia regenti]
MPHIRSKSFDEIQSQESSKPHRLLSYSSLTNINDEKYTKCRSDCSNKSTPYFTHVSDSTASCLRYATKEVTESDDFCNIRPKSLNETSPRKWKWLFITSNSKFSLSSSVSISTGCNSSSSNNSSTRNISSSTASSYRHRKFGLSGYLPSISSFKFKSSKCGNNQTGNKNGGVNRSKYFQKLNKPSPLVSFFVFR